MNKLFFTSLILTVFASIILPREFYQEDMMIHIPLMKSVSSQDLYQRDYLMQLGGQQRFLSLYYPVFFLLSRITPFDFSMDFKIFHSIYLFFLFFILFKLSGFYFNRLMPALVFILFLFLRFQVGGAAVQILEIELYPRALSFLFVLTALLCFLKRKIFLFALSLLLSICFHALTGLYTVCILLFFLIFYHKNKFSYISRNRKNILLVLTFISLVMLFTFSKVNRQWLSILQERNPYAFMTLWKPISWILLVLLIIPGIIYSFLLKEEAISKLFRIAFYTALFLSMLHVFFVSIFPTSSIIILQLGRVWIFPIYISLSIISYIFVSRFPRKATLVIFILFFCLAIFYNSKKMSHDPLNLISSQEWVRANTNTSCTILVPFSGKGFRVYSERTITGEYEDGGLAFYSETFAKEWYERFLDLKKWEELDRASLNILIAKYDVNYAVTSKSITEATLVFKNNDYNIYQLNSVCSL